MSRGGRGGRGGKKGPDLSWDDEVSTEVLPNARKPGPLFPERFLHTPKPLTASEIASFQAYKTIRDQIRKGPLYTVLDPTLAQSVRNASKYSRTDQPVSRPNLRAGFDPFNDQERYTMKYHRKRRTIPDLNERGCYQLKLFPLELWTTLDPKRKMPDWDTLTPEQSAKLNSTGSTARSRKRKRDEALKFDEENNEDTTATRNRGSGSDTDNNDDEDDDVIVRRKRKQLNTNNDRKNNNNNKPTRQKKGLDAEDDYPDVEQDEEADGEAGAGAEEEPADSNFETDEEDEGDMDDYNAEQYFDDGADDGDFGGGDGDDDERGGFY